MASMTGPGGLIPEQVWDQAAIPEKGLFPGKPSGSAMPLVWAHAEFLKLLLARQRGRPIELLDAVRQRYQGQAPEARTWHWRSDVPFSNLPGGRSLVIESTRPFVLRLGFDGWHEVQDRPSAAIGLGIQGVRLENADVSAGRQFYFTFLYPDVGQWEGRDYIVNA